MQHNAYQSFYWKMQASIDCIVVFIMFIVRDGKNQKLLFRQDYGCFALENVMSHKYSNATHETENAT